MIVVFPVCKKDIGLAILHARWLRQMGMKNNRLAVIFAETGCGDINGLKSLLQESFTRVGIMTYEPIPFRWPQVANQVFQHVARTMEFLCDPWLFMEADAVFLRPDALAIMEAEYGRGGKDFMGARVKGMGHFNGVAVYAANTPELLPEALDVPPHQAWDMVMDRSLFHDASHLIQHVWCISGSKWLECGSGSVPGRMTVVMAQRNIRKDAVLLHRWKDDSLLKLLISGQYKP